MGPHFTAPRPSAWHSAGAAGLQVTQHVAHGRRQRAVYSRAGNGRREKPAAFAACRLGRVVVIAQSETTISRRLSRKQPHMPGGTQCQALLRVRHELLPALSFHIPDALASAPRQGALRRVAGAATDQRGTPSLARDFLERTRSAWRPFIGKELEAASAQAGMPRRRSVATLGSARARRISGKRPNSLSGTREMAISGRLNRIHERPCLRPRAAVRFF